MIKCPPVRCGMNTYFSAGAAQAAAGRADSGESYIDWARANIVGAKINLARSGLSPLTPEEFGLDISDLPVTVEDFAFLRRYEALVAERHGTSPDRVVASTGTSHANMLAAMAFVRPGDNVVVEMPTYEPLISLWRYFGVEVKRIARDYESGWKIDAAELERIADEKTKLLILTSPHNPSGATLSHEEIRALADIMARRGGVALVDEVYLDFWFDGRAPAGLLADNIITTSSLTKVYGLGTLRAGWALGNPQLISRMRRCIDYSVGNSSFPTLLIATRVFENFDRFTAHSKTRAEANRKLLLDWLATAPGIECFDPGAGIVYFPKITAPSLDSDGLFMHLRNKYDTTIVPGRFFDGMSKHFRLAIGAPEAETRQGLANLASALRDLTG